MLQSWLPRTLSLGLVLLTTSRVQAANPIASKWWTLVGCDQVDLDSIVVNAADLAKAAISSINNIIDNAEFVLGDGSPQSNDARNAMLFWGVDPTDLAGGESKFEGTDVEVLKEVRGRYTGIVDALTTGGGYWGSGWSWVFCQPEQQPYPFVKATYVKDYLNTEPAGVQDELLSSFNIPDLVYYPDAGYLTQAVDPEYIGRRRVAFYGSDPNICNTAQSEPGRVVGAFVFHSPQDHTDWMALCSGFYEVPGTISPNIPDAANNLNLYKSQASQLLHELMHLRYTDIIDVNEQLPQMSEATYFYGAHSCAGLAGLFDGGSTNLAIQNADNYRLFAEASYLQSRKWDITATS